MIKSMIWASPRLFRLLAIVSFLSLLGVGSVLLSRERHQAVIEVDQARSELVHPVWDEPFHVGCMEPDTQAPRANATIFMLARNSDVHGAVNTIFSFELHFNRFFHYPYVFMNDEPFDQTFMDSVRYHASSDVEFVHISPDDWDFPKDIDGEWIQKSLNRQSNEAIMYGGQRSYHQMCRFLSGKFYRYPQMQKYKWYWRLEPDTSYWCDITYDVFLEMEKHNKVYGFTTFIEELRPTVWNLYRQTQAFKRFHNLPDTDLWDVISSCPSGDPMPKSAIENMDGCQYNMCHFWSNFEIARVDLWNNPIYDDYFNWLENAGGFWRERWGDAPVHTFGAALMANVSQIHYFRDIGYVHTAIGHCPKNAPNQIPFEKYGDYSVQDAFWKVSDPPVPNGVGCRCRCPKGIRDTEEHFCFRSHLGPALNRNIFPLSATQ